jgi:hypothetical protein
MAWREAAIIMRPSKIARELATTMNLGPPSVFLRFLLELCGIARISSDVRTN